VFNYRTAGYRSRRLVYMTDRIHHDTLTGKGYSYWNSNKKRMGKWFSSGAISVLPKPQRRLLLRYCNQYDCFAYLLVNANDHTDVKNNFSTLVTDVGDQNILNVSDYRDLIKTTPKTRGSKG
jgi:hypothetical protein